VFWRIEARGTVGGTARWLTAQWLVHPEGRVGVRKIEKKSAQTRRVVLEFRD